MHRSAGSVRIILILAVIVSGCQSITPSISQAPTPEIVSPAPATDLVPTLIPTKAPASSTPGSPVTPSLSPQANPTLGVQPG